MGLRERACELNLFVKKYKSNPWYEKANAQNFVCNTKFPVILIVSISHLSYKYINFWIKYVHQHPVSSVISKSHSTREQFKNLTLKFLFEKYIQCINTFFKTIYSIFPLIILYTVTSKCQYKITHFVRFAEVSGYITWYLFGITLISAERDKRTIKPTFGHCVHSEILLTRNLKLFWTLALTDRDWRGY